MVKLSNEVQMEVSLSLALISLVIEGVTGAYDIATVLKRDRRDDPRDMDRIDYIVDVIDATNKSSGQDFCPIETSKRLLSLGLEKHKNMTREEAYDYVNQLSQHLALLSTVECKF